MQRTAKNPFDQYAMFEPQSDWQIPTELPDLSRETEIAIDIETRDDSLKRNEGPGFHKHERGNTNTGYVCGISVAWRQSSTYIPIIHDKKPYFSHDIVQRWLKAIASQNNTRYIFHNFQYDWGWLEAVFGIHPPANIDDTAAMASMIDENLESFSLDNLCKWQGLPGKHERILEAIADNHKVKHKNIKEYLWELHPKYVGPYAEQDAMATLLLSQKLRPQLESQNLTNAYQTERSLMPITLKMKQRGIRVNAPKARKLVADINKQCEKELYELSNALGKKVEIKHLRSSKWLKDEFDNLGIVYPRTAPTENYEDGQASFEKSFMAKNKHWLPRTIHRIKHTYDLADKFLKKFIVDYEYNGRVYPTVNQFRSESGGARSHRFSYADPPLQQIPSRDDEFAPLIRSCFIPEDGEEWCSIDYRQQEYRLIVFVAELCRAPGAHAAAQMYRTDPKTDFHDYVAKITGLERRRAKDVNFATSYGAGVKKFMIMTGMGEEEAKATLDQYNEELPFVRAVSDKYSRYATMHGHIRLIDGARNHFNLWEPVYRDYALEFEYKKKNSGLYVLPCPEQEAERRRNDPTHPWSGEKMKRAYCHKAFNRMIQGSAARQMKKAMVDIYNAGHQPVLQMHDELGFSFSDRKYGKICSEIMENAMPVITIPMTTDVEWGPNWGELKK